MAHNKMHKYILHCNLIVIVNTLLSFFSYKPSHLLSSLNTQAVLKIKTNVSAERDH